ncbi:glutathione S-transferase, N-terminal domain protein [Leptospira wolbachii serovar Codice str. CDC]|uniref:Glutathione S-transferase, N-terminal domain protein n=1 Tax=Leptospira wolbachii serovar Codice str. CDC TaxID=1218599 RepID=R9ACI0_9LEPT|nr:glutathione S-transferase family protein [Leptospira wolbachii]EOQ97880.1 glutathione S-transferase, N-terminal domain protein [Leptospira wolbachii serovar Codice str. CDC]
MKLYGSITSPFVRRIRFLCLELGIPFTMVDTMTEAGQKELRDKNPLWKVPYAEIDDVKIWDSHTIIDYLFETKGSGNFRPKAGPHHYREANLQTAIDQALDNAILIFYLNKEGIKPDAAPYLTKNALRISSILDYIKRELNGHFFFTDGKVGLSEIALYTTLDWIRFRSVLPVEEDPVFAGFLNFHGQNKSWKETAPKQ